MKEQKTNFINFLNTKREKNLNKVTKLKQTKFKKPATIEDNSLKDLLSKYKGEIFTIENVF